MQQPHNAAVASRMARSAKGKFQVVTFASSTKSGDDNDSLTPSSIPAQRPPSTKAKPSSTDKPTPSASNKAKQPTKQPSRPTIDPGKAMPTPSESHKTARSRDNEADPPGPKRQRTLRKSTVPVVYNGKWHPMDDVLNPKRAAKVKNRGIKPAEPLDSESDVEMEVEAQHKDNDDSDEEEDEAPAPVKARCNKAPARFPTRSLTRSPSPDRRRSRRTSGNSEAPNYSIKYHPMDVVTKPNAPATIAAQVKTKTRPRRSLSSNNTTSTLSSLSTLKDDPSTPELTTDEKPKPVPKSTATTKPSFSKLQHVAIPELPEYEAWTPSPLGVSAKTPVKQTGARSVTHVPETDSSGTLSELRSPAKLDTKSQRNNAYRPPTKLLADLLYDSPSNPASPPAWSKLGNPYIKRRALDPEKLCSLDRILYSYQRGAPLGGETLPHTWQEVKQVLFNHAEITLDDLNGKEGTKWLKARYEDLRLGVEAFFGSQPEPSTRQDWVLTLAEGFDVFDKSSGVKYWKHRRYSVVTPTPTTDCIGHLQQREVPETEDEGLGDVLDNETFTKDESTENDHTAWKRPDPDKPEPRGSFHSKVETKATTFVDLECSTDLDHEEILVENMRGGDNLTSHVMMGMDDLADVLSPAERFFADVPSKQDVTTNGTLNRPSSARSSQSISSNATKPTPPSGREYGSQPTIHKAKPLHLPAFDLVEGPPGTQSSTAAGHRPGEYYSPKPQIATNKRKSRVVSLDELKVYEDGPGRTPLVQRIVDQNPASPGTDLPIENLDEVLTSSQRSSQGTMGTPQANRRRHIVTTPIARRGIRPGIGAAAGPF